MKKYLIVIVVISILFFAFNYLNNNVNALQQFFTPADIVVGQPDFISRQSNNGGEGSYDYPEGITIAGGKMIVTSWPGHKVYIYNTIPSSGIVVPDVTLTDGILGPNTVSNISSALYDGTKLYVPDWGNHRILIFNSLPTSSTQSADIVLGQPNMTSNTANNGGISAHSLKNPTNVFISGTKFIVTDTGNNRVLIWDSIPTTTNEDADWVIGQADMLGGSENFDGINAGTLKSPVSSAVYLGKLVVNDKENNRVLVFNTIPSSNHALADYVIGQSGMTTNTSNFGGLSDKSLAAPGAINITSDGKLIVVDRSNNRVLIFNSIPSSNYKEADIVLGQTLFTTNTCNNGGLISSSLCDPSYAYSDPTTGKLYVSDAFNSRILVWNTTPISNNQVANFVIGQNSFTESISLKLGYNGPISSIFVNNKLVVSDTYNHRVLIYNSIPTSNFASPDVVIGQRDLYSNIRDSGDVIASNKNLHYPSGLATDGTKLIISDRSNNRVLIYNQLPTEDFQMADLELGHSGFTQDGCNQEGLNASSLCGPWGNPYTDGTKLIIADSNNNRILIWNTFPTTNGEAADVVVGQINMTSNTTGTTDQKFDWPTDVSVYQNKLIVTDYYNNRALVFNSIPTLDYENADVVIGQENFNTSDVFHGGISEKSFYDPEGSATSEKGELWIADGYARVFYYKSIPTTNYASADGVIGTEDFITDTYNYPDGDPTQSNISYAYGMNYSNGKLVIADTSNNRVLIYTLGPKITSVTAPNRTITNTLPITTSGSQINEIMVSPNVDFSGASWQTYTTPFNYSFTDIEGSKTLYVKYSDFAEYESQSYTLTFNYDKSAPTGTISINSGAISTTSLNVTLELSAVDLTSVTKMRISNTNDFINSEWIDYSTSKNWTLLNGASGNRIVYIQYKDIYEQISITYQDSIQYTLITNNSIRSTTISSSEPIISSVTYRLLDPNENPIPNTLVTIYPEGIQAYTDSNGYIIFNSIDTSILTHTLKFTFNGQLIVVNVTGNDIDIITSLLSSSSTSKVSSLSKSSSNTPSTTEVNPSGFDYKIIIFIIIGLIFIYIILYFIIVRLRKGSEKKEVESNPNTPI